MLPERAVRVSLNLLYARRHCRDVPEDEIARDVRLEQGVVDDALASLSAQRLAVRTDQGWRPGSPSPPTSRARVPTAAFSWIHA